MANAIKVTLMHNKNFTYHWASVECLIDTSDGGSQTHSPDTKFAYMRSLVRGSTISTHSALKIHPII